MWREDFEPLVVEPAAMAATVAAYRWRQAAAVVLLRSLLQVPETHVRLLSCFSATGVEKPAERRRNRPVDPVPRDRGPKVSDILGLLVGLLHEAVDADIGEDIAAAAEIADQEAVVVPEGWAGRVQRLEKDFPTVHRQLILDTLELHEGHYGVARKDLARHSTAQQTAKGLSAGAGTGSGAFVSFHFKSPGFETQSDSDAESESGAGVAVPVAVRPEPTSMAPEPTKPPLAAAKPANQAAPKPRKAKKPVELWSVESRPL
jgi:hypothetical protein